MKFETFMNQLIREGTIERVGVNRYRVNASRRARALSIGEQTNVPASIVRTMFGNVIGEGNIIFKAVGTVGSAPRAAAPVRPLRHLIRHSYHSNGHGEDREGVERALSRIAADADGVRRSYGMEFEIYAIPDSRVESDLCYLLDELPEHVVERDGSLRDSGCEIVFAPMSEEVFVDTWTKLCKFVKDNNCGMDGAGTHVTYGVNNSEIRNTSDLQIRLARFALAVKSVGTQGSIKRVFGRDFTGYAHLPSYRLAEMDHSNAFSASRGNSAWECRLCKAGGDVRKIVEFLKATECVFHRPVKAEDFMKVFEIMGANTDGQ